MQVQNHHVFCIKDQSAWRCRKHSYHSVRLHDKLTIPNATSELEVLFTFAGNSFNTFLVANLIGS